MIHVDLVRPSKIFLFVFNVTGSFYIKKNCNGNLKKGISAYFNMF
jgi:hypothetical protein